MDSRYQFSYIAAATTTTVVAAGSAMLHTINFPIALTGTATFNDIAGSPVTYFVFPIGTIGSFRLDLTVPNGLKVVTSATDKLIITYVTP